MNRHRKTFQIKKRKPEDIAKATAICSVMVGFISCFSLSAVMILISLAGIALGIFSNRIFPNSLAKAGTFLCAAGIVIEAVRGIFAGTFNVI